MNKAALRGTRRVHHALHSNYHYSSRAAWSVDASTGSSHFMPRRILLRLRAIIRGTGDKNVARIKRRQALAALAWRTLPKLK